jgi:hypothetical protein
MNFKVIPIFMLLLSPVCWADCVAELTAAEAKDYFELGRKQQAGGQDVAALDSYIHARTYVCDQGGNPVLRQAILGAAALGKKNGLLAEQKKHWFDDNAKQYGAFQWYEKSGYFAKADHALVQALKLNPADIQLSAFAQEHFRQRSMDYFSHNNADIIAATEPYQLSQQDFAYVVGLPAENIKLLLQKQPDLTPKEYLDGLSELASAHDELQPTDLSGQLKLQERARSFAGKWQDKGLESCAQLFELALQWTRQMLDYSKADVLKQQIEATRLEVAHSFSRDYAHSYQILNQALSFYMQADRADLVQKVRVQALAAGDKAMASGLYQRASQFYSVAGQDEKTQLAEQKLAEQRDKLSQQMAGNHQQQIEAMKALASDPEKLKAMQQNALKLQQQLQQKQHSQQKKFGEETENLADELGIE